jgi:hypothetical protein
VTQNTENMAPAKPILVGLYCWDCKMVRKTDGSVYERHYVGGKCGVDYGEGFNSHLNVWPVYALPPEAQP